MVQAVVIVLIIFKAVLFAVCIYRYAEKNQTPLPKDLLNYVLIVKKKKKSSGFGDYDLISSPFLLPRGGVKVGLKVATL